MADEPRDHESVTEKVERELDTPATEAAERQLDRVADKVEKRIDQVDAEPADEFGRVFVLILLTIVITPFATYGPVFLVLAMLIQVFTVFTALRTSKVRPRTLLVVMVFTLLVFALVTVSIVVGSVNIGRIAFSIGMLPMIVMVPVAIVRRLLHHKYVTIHTVWGALSIYLILGLFFAVTYGLFAIIDPPFFAQSNRTPLATDYIYFSFVTLTTVGYGDLTARAAMGQMLAISEALIGQIFLVTVVALLVSRVKPEHRATESAFESLRHHRDSSKRRRFGHHEQDTDQTDASGTADSPQPDAGTADPQTPRPSAAEE